MKSPDRRRNERGFTLIELVVGVAIAGIIVTGLGAVISQISDVSSRSRSHLMLVTDVENAVHWVNRDAQMAQAITPTGLSGFPLTLRWVEWDNTSSAVTYLVQNNELRRSYSVNGGQPTTTVVSRHINDASEMTNVQYAGGVFSARITTFIGGYRPVNETRSIKVLPRSISK